MKNYQQTIFLLTFSVIFTFCFLPNWRAVSGNKSIKKLKIDFVEAAKQNDQLQYSLQWTFGRKAQKGWYLYVPLIRETLKIDDAANTPKFAEAILKWQRQQGIKENGILDRETLFSFINYWQSRRLKRITLAEEKQLLTADIENFYDPTRDIELLKIERETFQAYKKMLNAAIADKSLGLEVDEAGNLTKEEKFLKLISTYRSPAYQAGLRKKEPNASRAQIAFKSPHFTGRALDIYVGGEPVTTKDFNRAIQIKTPFYKWLVRNAERFGFYPYFYEPWHWEYVP